MRNEDHHMNHTLNTSTLRKTCKFSTAPRFQQHPNLNTDFKYNIASKRSNRSTSFGVGPRPMHLNSMTTPNPNRYNISQFPSDRRGATLGEGRERATFRSMVHDIEKKTELPSPDAYDCVEPRGKGWSLRVRLPSEADHVARRHVPGPGQYAQIQMNRQGKYFTSKIRNTRSIAFGVLRRKEYFRRPDTNLGPGSYDVFADSEFSQNRVQIMRRNTAKNFGTGKRLQFSDRSKVVVPGPGQYDSFSSFGNTFVPTIS